MSLLAVLPIPSFDYPDMPKRARETQDDTSSQVAAPEAPKQKKTRLSAVPPASASKPHKLDSSAASSKKGKRTKKAVRESRKRPILPGRLNRLAVPKPQSLAARKGGSGSTRPDVNRRGNKINKGWGTGGFDTAPPAGTSTEDIGELASDKDKKTSSKSNKAAPVGAEMWITRKSAYSAYLKSGVAAFMHKGSVDTASRPYSRSQAYITVLQQPHLDSSCSGCSYSSLFEPYIGNPRCATMRRRRHNNGGAHRQCGRK